MDVETTVIATTFTLSLSGVAAALITFGEFREHKKNINEKVDNNFKLLKDEMVAHEERDNDRQKEIIERLERAEDRIIRVIEGNVGK